MKASIFGFKFEHVMSSFSITFYSTSLMAHHYSVSRALICGKQYMYEKKVHNMHTIKNMYDYKLSPAT